MNKIFISYTHRDYSLAIQFENSMKNLLKNHSFNIDAVEFFIAQRDAEGEWETDIKK